MNAAATPVAARLFNGRFADPSGRRLLLGILSCERNAARAAAVRGTWMQLLPDTVQLLFLQGRPGRAAGIEGDVLYLDCPETYEDLPRKVHAFLDYSVAHLDFDVLFKTDDDSYLDLARFLAFDRHQADYIGQFREAPVGNIGKTWHYGKCTDKTREVPWERPFVCPWATGGGYFLSRRAAALAAERTAANCADHLFEDMMVGEALSPDPSLRIVMTRFSEFGLLNPLLPKDMHYVQDMVLEREALRARVAALEAQSVARLAASS